MSTGAEWESEAENWVRWARTPNFDAYWYYRDAFFDDLLPPAPERTVEIGCGEGRVTRDLVARGHRVMAVDTSPTLLRYARQDDSCSSYLLADGASLPFPRGSFDLAVSYNSLQVVADMPDAVREAARVLVDNGTFCVCTTHPFSDLGQFVSDDQDARYVVRPSYFTRERVDDTVERGGLTMTFRGWTYTLEDYVRAFEEAGLCIDTVREPRPIKSNDRYARFQRVPMFLNIRAIKP